MLYRNSILSYWKVKVLKLMDKNHRGTQSIPSPVFSSRFSVVYECVSLVQAMNPTIPFYPNSQELKNLLSVLVISMYTMIGSPHKHIGSFPHNDKICDSSLEGYYNIDKRQNGLKFVVVLVKRVIIFTSTYIVLLQILFLVIQIEIQAQNHALCSPQCPPPHRFQFSHITKFGADCVYKVCQGSYTKVYFWAPSLALYRKIRLSLHQFDLFLKTSVFITGQGPPSSLPPQKKVLISFFKATLNSNW